MNPDELLQQIRQLLDEYLAMGEDTPVAPEAQALAEAIDAGGAAPEDPMAGGGDQMPMMGGDTPVPDMAGMAPEGGVPAGASLRDASAMAEEDMLKRMKKSKGV